MENTIFILRKVENWRSVNYVGFCDGNYSVFPAWVTASLLTLSSSRGMGCTCICTDIVEMMEMKKKCQKSWEKESSVGTESLGGDWLRFNSSFLCPHPYELKIRHKTPTQRISLTKIFLSHQSLGWPITLCAISIGDKKTKLSHRHFAYSGKWSFSAFTENSVLSPLHLNETWLVMLSHLHFDCDSWLTFVIKAYNTINSQAQIISNSMFSMN